MRHLQAQLIPNKYTFNRIPREASHIQSSHLFFDSQCKDLVSSLKDIFIFFCDFVVCFLSVGLLVCLDRVVAALLLRLLMMCWPHCHVGRRRPCRWTSRRPLVRSDSGNVGEKLDWHWNVTFSGLWQNDCWQDELIIVKHKLCSWPYFCFVQFCIIMVESLKGISHVSVLFADILSQLLIYLLNNEWQANFVQYLLLLNCVFLFLFFLHWNWH